MWRCYEVEETLGNQCITSFGGLTDFECPRAVVHTGKYCERNKSIRKIIWSLRVANCTEFTNTVSVLTRVAKNFSDWKLFW